MLLGQAIIVSLLHIAHSHDLLFLQSPMLILPSLQSLLFLKNRPSRQPPPFIALLASAFSVGCCVLSAAGDSMGVTVLLDAIFDDASAVCRFFTQTCKTWYKLNC